MYSSYNLELQQEPNNREKELERKAARTTGRSWKGPGRFIIGFLLFWIVALFILPPLLTPGCSLWTGSCDYDPRTQAASALFIEGGPDKATTDYIWQEVAQIGTFPSRKISPVTAVTPTHVKANGFYSGWLVGANVAVDVQYADGTVQEYQFELRGGGEQILGLELTMMHASFGNPIRCEPVPEEVWNSTFWRC